MAVLTPLWAAVAVVAGGISGVADDRLVEILSRRQSGFAAAVRKQIEGQGWRDKVTDLVEWVETAASKAPPGGTSE